MVMTYIKVNDGRKSAIIKLDQVDIFQAILRTFSCIVMV